MRPMSDVEREILSEHIPEHGGLLPCPFCGASIWGDVVDDTNPNYYYDQPTVTLWHEPECFLGRSTSILLESDKARNWNRRKEVPEHHIEALNAEINALKLTIEYMRLRKAMMSDAICDRERLDCFEKMIRKSASDLPEFDSSTGKWFTVSLMSNDGGFGGGVVHDFHDSLRAALDVAIDLRKLHGNP